jgi:predicted nuclease with TOPRIM domain
VDIRERAKELGIESYWNKKIERLEKEIAELKPKADKIPINTEQDDNNILKNLNFEALNQYAKEMGATRLNYLKRRRAFEAYKDEQLLDLLSISMF